MYIVAGQGQTTPGDKILMSTETSCHFRWSLILYIFFQDFIHVYSPGAGVDNPLGTKFLFQQEHLVTSAICCKFKKISLKSDSIPFFDDFIHVYSPGAGADSPQGTKSTETSCYFIHLLQVSKQMSLKSDFIQFFHDLIHVYSPGAGADNPREQILMSTERPYHFTHLLWVSKKSLWSLILYNFFHDLIHVYSPGAGGIQPPGDKVLMSTKTSFSRCY